MQQTAVCFNGNQSPLRTIFKKVEDMKAKMVFVAIDGSGVIRKEYDWNDTLNIPTDMDANRTVKVSKVSTYDHTPLIDGKLCRIASMLSAETWS